MIVAETADGIRFVAQPEHAALAGRFADQWGNDAFDRPEPRPETVMAAYTHDDGWFGYDRRPHLDEDGAPIDFRGTPADTWLDLYDEGIDEIVALDPYAGLLVSMHGAGLRRQRYGLSPAWPDTPPAYRDFVDREEARQERLVAELREAGRASAADVDLLSALHRSGGAPDGASSRLWYGYRLLQAWDTLSLAFCTTGSPPSYDEIERVPTGVDGEEETLTIEPAGTDEYLVDPYPFDESPLAASVPARTVSREAFDGDAALLQAYYESDREWSTVTLRRDGR